MKKRQITNNVLLERSKLFARYAENMPSKTDKLELQLDFPYCGLIKMHFLVNNEEKLLIDASNVYEPFEDIRDWLDRIVTQIFDFTTAAVKINDEFDDYILYYEQRQFFSINYQEPFLYDYMNLKQILLKFVILDASNLLSH